MSTAAMTNSMPVSMLSNSSAGVSRSNSINTSAAASAGPALSIHGKYQDDYQPLSKSQVILQIREAIQDAKEFKMKTQAMPEELQNSKNKYLIQIYYSKLEFAKNNREFMKRLFLFYLAYDFLKVNLKIKSTSEHSTAIASLFIDRILVSLLPVLEFQKKFHKAWLDMESGEEDLLKQDIGKSLVDFLALNDVLFEDYTEGAIILNIEDTYEEIKKEVEIIFPDASADEFQKSMKRMQKKGDFDDLDVAKEKGPVAFLKEQLKLMKIDLDATEQTLCDYKTYATAMVQRATRIPMLIDGISKNLRKAIDRDEENSIDQDLKDKFEMQYQNLEKAADLFKSNTKQINDALTDRAGKMQLKTILSSVQYGTSELADYGTLKRKTTATLNRARQSITSTSDSGIDNNSINEKSQSSIVSDSNTNSTATLNRNQSLKQDNLWRNFKARYPMLDNDNKSNSSEYIENLKILHYGTVKLLKQSKEYGTHWFYDNDCFLLERPADESDVNSKNEKLLVMFQRKTNKDGWKLNLEVYENAGKRYRYEPIIQMNSAQVYNMSEKGENEIYIQTFDELLFKNTYVMHLSDAQKFDKWIQFSDAKLPSKEEASKIKKDRARQYFGSMKYQSKTAAMTKSAITDFNSMLTSITEDSEAKAEKDKAKQEEMMKELEFSKKLRSEVNKRRDAIAVINEFKKSYKENKIYKAELHGSSDVDDSNSRHKYHKLYDFHDLAKILFHKYGWEPNYTNQSIKSAQMKALELTMKKANKLPSTFAEERFDNEWPIVFAESSAGVRYVEVPYLRESVINKKEKKTDGRYVEVHNQNGLVKLSHPALPQIDEVFKANYRRSLVIEYKKKLHKDPEREKLLKQKLITYNKLRNKREDYKASITQEFKSVRSESYISRNKLVQNITKHPNYICDIAKINNQNAKIQSKTRQFYLLDRSIVISDLTHPKQLISLYDIERILVSNKSDPFVLIKMKKQAVEKNGFDPSKGCFGPSGRDKFDAVRDLAVILKNGSSVPELVTKLQETMSRLIIKKNNEDKKLDLKIEFCGSDVIEYKPLLNMKQHVRKVKISDNEVKILK